MSTKSKMQLQEMREATKLLDEIRIKARLHQGHRFADELHLVDEAFLAEHAICRKPSFYAGRLSNP